MQRVSPLSKHGAHLAEGTNELVFYNVGEASDYGTILPGHRGVVDEQSRLWRMKRKTGSHYDGDDGDILFMSQLYHDPEDEQMDSEDEFVPNEVKRKRAQGAANGKSSHSKMFRAEFTSSDAVEKTSSAKVGSPSEGYIAEPSSPEAAEGGASREVTPHLEVDMSIFIDPVVGFNQAASDESPWSTKIHHSSPLRAQNSTEVRHPSVHPQRVPVPRAARCDWRWC